MNINYTDTKIGDCAYLEPALAALPECNLFIAHKPLKYLYKNHPTIKLVDSFLPDGKELEAGRALSFAVANGLPFAAGYFEQVGLPVSGRFFFKMFGQPESGRGDFVCIAPFAYSCTDPYSGKGLITWPLENWRLLVPKLGCPVIALGGAADPDIPGCVNVRGASFDVVCGLLRASKGLISVETGLLAVSAACCNSVVFLSSATRQTLCSPGVDRLRVIRSKNNVANWPIDDVASAAAEIFS